MLGEVLVPVMQGERVVLAQVLLMHHVEAGVMDARFDEAGRAEITVREDVTVEEFVGTGLAVGLVVADGDLVVQQSAHRLQKAEHLFEVALVVLDAYVLHHADRADTVEVVLRHLAVVLHTHFGQILQPFTGDPFVGVRGLFLGKGDAERLDAATGGGDDHRTPAAADVQ